MLEIASPVHEAWPTLEDDPRLGAFGRAYYAAALPGRIDCSFQIQRRSIELLYVAADLVGESFGWSGFPAHLIGRSDRLDEDAVSLAVDTLLAKASDGKARLSIACGLEPSGGLDAVGRVALEKGATFRVKTVAIADVSGGEAAIRQDLRRRFRQYVNWGEKQLLIETMCGESVGREDFDRYRALHRRAAGRDTRPDQSWDRQYDAVRLGQAELIVGAMAGIGDVAATYIVHGRVTSVYWSGAYDRERFDKPLSHYPMLLGMYSAHARGVRYFDIGEIPDAAEPDQKLKSIGRFKKGFTSRLVPQLVAEWTGGRE